MEKCIRIGTLIIILISVIISSCNEEDDAIAVAPTNQLKAVAGPDQNVIKGTLVSLDGSESFDKSKNPFTFLWTFKTKPQGSNVTIQTPTSAEASFTPTTAGVYVIQLTIKQGKWEAKDEVIIQVTSDDPEEPVAGVLNEDINASTTLTDIFEDPDQPDYVVTENIDVRADLTIMPGVVIGFEEHTGLQIIQGSISAKGTSEKAIVFHGLGGRASYWKGIVLHTANELNAFEYVTITEAGSGPFQETGIKAALTLGGTYLSGATARISNSTFEKSGGYGLYLQGTSLVTDFTSNTFSYNMAAGAFIPAHDLHMIDRGSVFTGNSIDGVETAGAVRNSAAVLWKSLDAPYLVSGDLEIEAGVTIEAGSTFLIKQGMSITVTENGYLNATGSATARIVFTSVVPSQYWDGIFLNTQSSLNKLHYCDISNAGFQRFGDEADKSNITLGNGGQLSMENSTITNGLGYGLIARYVYQVNENMALVNTFGNLAKGLVLPKILLHPDRPSLAGDWVDQWSLIKGITEVDEDYYVKETGTWFHGAADPWSLPSGKGMGIRISENGDFVWAIGEHAPMTGCPSWSAEYITGTINVTDETITFSQEYWRSKFVNSCEPDQNVDMEITPSDIVLKYEYNKLYNLFTGEVSSWELKFFNPDGSSFSLYRKPL